MDDQSRRGTTITILATGLSLVAYFFALAEPLSTELTAMPRWVVPLASGQGTASAGTRIPFSAGDLFGYFAEDGSVFFMNSAPGGAAVADGAYATLADARLYRLGKPEAVGLAGLPFFDSGALYSGLADGTGLNAYDADGALKWTYRFPCLLSATAGSPGLWVGGTVDGWLEGVDADGKRAFSFSPGGSRISVILGLAVSPSGRWIAAISGLDRQRLVILGRGGTDFRVASHRYLDSDYRGPTPVSFLDDEGYALYLRPDGIGVWSVDGRTDDLLPVKADGFTVSMDEGTGVAYLVARKGDESELVAFKPPARVLGRIALPRNLEYLRMSGSTLYFFADKRLARVDFWQE